MTSPNPRPASSWYRPMTARRSDEQHRVSTNLELFFDLCFVAAVAQAAIALEHEISAGHTSHGVLGYVLVFFAIWWAWMNFTWFASAYDTDDVPYRLLTLLQITGALVMAAGAQAAVADYDFTVITIGYVIMRLAMVTQWLRAARTDPERRPTCLRYATGILIVQAGWVARLFLPENAGLPAFLVLAVAELAVPLWAERAGRTTWHPHHIAERYGLFTIIVLGESITSATAAVHGALDSGASFATLAALSAGGVLTVFALWWLYFTDNAPHRLHSLAAAMRWGYGHYALFAAAAAVGAGLALNTAAATGHTEATHIATATAYTLPVAVYLLVLRLLQRGATPSGLRDALWAAGALAVALASFTTGALPVLLTGLITTVLVTVTTSLPERPATADPAPTPA
ncbi:low temperature requirement protein A [Streptomyces sp. NPDC090077]|uniref:low temperature requirement protein A n=1 Tax=Streptomyces sp. NPDC090077 TaxID=3365938 RepID=UPI003820F6CD